jgi:hypothetical protein
MSMSISNFFLMSLILAASTEEVIDIPSYLPQIMSEYVFDSWMWIYAVYKR